jgi:acetyl-CoA carboxylase biotin carboxyl carrier protein
MIDIKTLKELVRLMVDNDLAEMDLRDADETVTLKRAGPNAAPVVVASPQHVVHSAPAAAPAPAAGGSAPAAAPSDDGAGKLAIESPMVGTFYSAADPDSPPFLSVGKTVSKDEVVCLIEAMKVFNEIKSEVSGVVERVLVQNGQAVEFGQKLFLVRPS